MRNFAIIFEGQFMRFYASFDLRLHKSLMKYRSHSKELSLWMDKSVDERFIVVFLEDNKIISRFTLNSRGFMESYI